jgi:hypothetical protein
MLMITTSCAVSRQEKLVEYKKMTEHINIKNQTEVVLAQHLYNKFVNNKK